MPFGLKEDFSILHHSVNHRKTTLMFLSAHVLFKRTVRFFIKETPNYFKVNR
jgi:hypothetical protein